MIVDQSRHVFAIQQPEIWWMNVKEMKENINPIREHQLKNLMWDS